MTNEFKKNILDYITNNVNEESGNNVPLFNQEKEYSGTVYSMIRTALGVSASSIIISGDLIDNESQLTLLYGLYVINNSIKGFIYLLGQDMNEVQLITTHTTGSDLFPIDDMGQDEDGNIYAISTDGTPIMRVLLYNNIFTPVNNTYIARLRQSYIVPNSSNYRAAQYTTFYSQKQKNIIKIPNEATYYLFLEDKNDNFNSLAIRFTINVGSTNEWVVIPLNINTEGYDILVEKNGEQEKLYYYTNNLSTASNGEFRKYLIENDTATLQATIQTDLEDIEWCIAVSNNEQYIVGLDYPGNVYIKKYSNNTLTTIIQYEQNTVVRARKMNNFILTFSRKTQSLHVENAKVGILYNDILTESQVITTFPSRESFFAIYNFNLLSVFITAGAYQTDEKTIKLTLDYYPLNYNGLPYSDYNQTKAVKGRLYSNGEMVFARNLYNTTLLNNTTTNVLNVPNTLLNDTEINVENLIGATNGVLVSNTLTITKNVYENLYINFVNSINVVDEDTDTYYPGAANYINQNINVGTQANCETTFASKVRINYSTPIEKNIAWSWNTDHYETGFGVDTSQEIPTSVDFISSEGNIYLTKTLNLVANKLYSIKQKLRIE